MNQNSIVITYFLPVLERIFSMSVVTKALLVDFGTIILTFGLLCLRANPACTDPQIFSVTSKESDAIRQIIMEIRIKFTDQFRLE